MSNPVKPRTVRCPSCGASCLVSQWPENSDVCFGCVVQAKRDKVATESTACDTSDFGRD
jgi:hypothetical protein